MYAGGLNSTASKPDKGELIIKAAMELFKERGYVNTRIIDIANKAEIGKGTVYAYFKSKDEILLRIINNIVYQDYGLLYEDVMKEGSVEKRLLKYIDNFEEMLDQYGVYALILKDQIVNNAFADSTEVKKVIAKLHDLQYDGIRKILQAGVDSGQLRDMNIHLVALFVMNSVGYYMITAALSAKEFSEKFCEEMAFFSSEKYPLERYLDKSELVDIILNGIAARSGGDGQK